MEDIEHNWEEERIELRAAEREYYEHEGETICHHCGLYVYECVCEDKGGEVMPEITIRRGDATVPESDHDLYHIVNDCRAWGRGFVLALSKRFPNIDLAFKQQHMRLGDVWYYDTPSGMRVVNLCAQTGIQSASNLVPLRMEALESTLKKAYADSLLKGRKVKMPKIGAGLAGGNWQDILALIQRVATVDTTIYML